MPSRNQLIRDWGGWWILAALVLFEFWDAQYWHSHYTACCVARTQLRAERQHQSTLRKSGDRDFAETLVQIGAPTYDLRMPFSQAAPYQDVTRNAVPQNNRNNPSLVASTDRVERQAWSFSSYPRSRLPQPELTADLPYENHTQSEATPSDFI
jgi:hypothetical protein